MNIKVVSKQITSDGFIEVNVSAMEDNFTWEGSVLVSPDENIVQRIIDTVNTEKANWEAYQARKQAFVAAANELKKEELGFDFARVEDIEADDAALVVKINVVFNVAGSEIPETISTSDVNKFAVQQAILNRFMELNRNVLAANARIQLANAVVETIPEEITS